MAAPILDEGDLGSQAWLKLKRHLEERLASLRARNDAPADEGRTARTRGRIAECKRMLSIGDPKRALDDDDDKFKD